METMLRALVVEDSEDDALLLMRHLSQANYRLQWRRVDTAAEMRAAMNDQKWDVVFSDWSMPQFSGRQAFTLFKESGLDIPFIIVSGTIGEETAVEAMRTGVHDFIVKGRLARLVPAIERGLGDAELRRRQAAIEHELRYNLEEARKLERDREEAQRESGYKSKFLTHMSHELRAPLNAIIGFSELLARGVPDPVTPVQRQYANDILESGQHLLKVINEILDLSKIEAGRTDLELKWLSFAALADSVHGIVHTLADKRGVLLEFAIPADLPDIYADPVRIKQILINLLSNAIKFTPAEGRVRLTADVDGEQFRIAVSDTGIGIRPEDLPRLFHEFERIEPLTGERPEGTGLGLMLTRQLVALHGGTISVQSTPGAGSTFTVLLPLRRLAQAS